MRGSPRREEPCGQKSGGISRVSIGREPPLLSESIGTSSKSRQPPPTFCLQRGIFPRPIHAKRSTRPAILLIRVPFLESFSLAVRQLLLFS